MPRVRPEAWIGFHRIRAVHGSPSSAGKQSRRLSLIRRAIDEVPSGWGRADAGLRRTRRSLVVITARHDRQGIALDGVDEPVRVVDAP